MDRFCETSLERINEEVARLKNKGKLAFSNYFGIEDGCIESYRLDNTMIIRKKENDYWRLYILTLDIQDAQTALTELNDSIYVINIPVNKGIGLWPDFLQPCGFSLYGVYNRYHNTKIKSRKAARGEFAAIEDLGDIKNLLYDYFSVYTDHLPSESELRQMILNGQILVSRYDNGKVGGVLIFTFENRKCYLNAWIDHTGNGLYLLYKVYNIIADNNIPYVYFWVNSENTQVINLHKLMGAEQDRIVDYTYIKQ